MISILLASYNGEKFIAEQINSLLQQTIHDFRLYIRDDRSTDSTFHIIQGFAEKHPDKIFVAQNDANLGAKYNFMKMMIEHKDAYVMLCDQDDVWLTEKIEVTLAKMKKMESEFGEKTPLLVHTDLRVVNEKLETVSPSFKAAMNADYSKTKLHHQVIQNTLTGCTVMYNRALADLITQTPSFMVAHDWWLMLIASAFGHISSLDNQTILYRQHTKNEIGARDVRATGYKINKLLHYREIKNALNDTYLQAQCFLDVHKERLTEGQKEFLLAYCDIPNHSKLIRWFIICRLGVLKNGWARKAANFIFI